MKLPSDAHAAGDLDALRIDQGALLQVGCKVRDLYAQERGTEARLRQRVDDAYVEQLAVAVAGGWAAGWAWRRACF